MLCYVMLCYVMLCYVMLCYVMLCYVMLCMLCYVMLCYVRCRCMEVNVILLFLSYANFEQTQKKPKTLSCPKDITQVTSKNPARVAWVEPMFKDNYDDQPIISANKVPGTQFPYGKSKVMYEALDKSGNVATCQFYVSVSREYPTDYGTLRT